MTQTLNEEGQLLCAVRHDSMWFEELGPFYVISNQDVIAHKNVGYGTLVKWARERGALKPHEHVDGVEDTAG